MEAHEKVDKITFGLNFLRSPLFNFIQNIDLIVNLWLFPGKGCQVLNTHCYVFYLWFLMD